MIPYRIRTQVNLKRDFMEFISKQMMKWGFPAVKDEQEYWSAIYEFYNLQLRMIDLRKREVLVASDFLCPSKYEDVVENIIENLEKGTSVFPYLSKNILESNYNDPLLNDWGVYHLHLGKKKDKHNPRFIERTKELLFLRIDSDKAYLINIYKHGDWSKTEILKSICANWPESIDEYIVDSCFEVSPKTTEATVKQARKKNAFVLHQSEIGKVYLPFGGGVASSGHNINGVKYADLLLTNLERLEKTMIENSYLFADAFIREQNIELSEIRLKLFIGQNGSAYIMELNSKEIFEVGPLI